MNKRQLRAACLCLALAACAGAHVSEDNAGYDPQAVRLGGPVDITVVGVPDAESSAIAAVVADALRYNGAQAGVVAPVGPSRSGYRVAILYGAAADALAASSGSTDYAGACHMINSRASAPSSSQSSPASNGTPLLALMCYRGEYQAAAYARLDASESALVALPVMMNQLFPPPPLSD